MNISDEQYEEMQRRIDDLTEVLGFLVSGKEILIPMEHMNSFKKAYQDQSLFIQGVKTERNGVCILVWMQKYEQK